MSQFVSDDNGHPLFTGLRVDCRVIEQSRLSGDGGREGEMRGRDGGRDGEERWRERWRQKTEYVSDIYYIRIVHTSIHSMTTTADIHSIIIDMYYIQ